MQLYDKLVSLDRDAGR